MRLDEIACGGDQWDKLPTLADDDDEVIGENIGNDKEKEPPC